MLRGKKAQKPQEKGEERAEGCDRHVREVKLMRRTAGITRRAALGAAAAVSAATLSGAWIRNAKAAANGTLTVALSDNPITCDPINMASHDSMILSQSIWENLLEFDVDGVLKPQLAKALLRGVAVHADRRA